MLLIRHRKSQRCGAVCVGDMFFSVSLKTHLNLDYIASHCNCEDLCSMNFYTSASEAGGPWAVDCALLLPSFFPEMGLCVHPSISACCEQVLQGQTRTCPVIKALYQDMDEH